jgi:hypothetical protein
MAGIERRGGNEQRQEHDRKAGDAEPALADPGRNQRTDPAGNRRDDVERKR